MSRVLDYPLDWEDERLVCKVICMTDDELVELVLGLPDRGNELIADAELTLKDYRKEGTPDPVVIFILRLILKRLKAARIEAEAKLFAKH
jgi:hypothetical protein